METLRRILIKMCSEPLHWVYTRLPAGRSLINLMHSLSTALLITLTHFSLLNYKRILQVEFLNYTFVHMQLECSKQSFKILKPEVLKATSFKRWNETLFQNFWNTYWLSKVLFKSVCINPILMFVLFKFCYGMYRSSIVNFHHTFSV